MQNHLNFINDLDLFRSAAGLQGRFQISFCDANLLAAAIALGCGTVFSEDLKAGQDYDRREGSESVCGVRDG